MPKIAPTLKQTDLLKIRPPTKGKTVVPVGTPSGLSLVIYKSGRRSWRYDSTLQAGPRCGERVSGVFASAIEPEHARLDKEEREKLGLLSLDEARQRAFEFREQVKRGIDPFKPQKPEAEAGPQEGETLRAVFARYIALPHFAARRSAEPVTKFIERRVLPTRVDETELGDMVFAEITRQDIEKMHATLTGSNGPYSANRALDELKALFNRMGRDGDNPCKRVHRNPEEGREYFLNDEQIAALRAVLDGLPNRDAADLILMHLLTLSRGGEVRGMKWSEIDLFRRSWTKPASRTKQKKRHVVPLSDEAIEILERRKAQQGGSSEFVFPSPTKEGEARKYPHRQWQRVKKAALPNQVRPHDLRHTGASLLASNGTPIQVVSAMLGHSHISTTMRYSHLWDDPLRDAAELVSKGGRRQ